MDQQEQNKTQQDLRSHTSVNKEKARKNAVSKDKQALETHQPANFELDWVSSSQYEFQSWLELWPEFIASQACYHNEKIL